MDWKLFASTFFLIFLAELGDKTQLTAMARATATEHGKWTVFWGASAALVCSTLVAILLGEQIRAWFDERHIKLVAAILFLVFGVLLLREALGKAEEEAAPAPKPTTAATGLLADVAFRIAASFETAAAAHYRELAASAPDGSSLKTLLADLAREEEAHLQHVESLAGEHAEVEVPATAPVAEPRLDRTQVALNEEESAVLRHVIEHEHAKAEFYSGLAREFHIAGLRDAFSQLAAEEREHARKIEAALKG